MECQNQMSQVPMSGEMQALRLKEFLIKRPSQISCFFGLNAGYNRRVYRRLRETLDSRTEEEVSTAWKNTGITESQRYEVVSYALKVSGMDVSSARILPDDDLLIFLGYGFSSVIDDFTLERFMMEMEKKYKVRLDPKELPELKELTFLGLIRQINSLPQNVSGRVTCGLSVRMRLFLIFFVVTSLSAGAYYGLKAGGVQNGILMAGMIFFIEVMIFFLLFMVITLFMSFRHE